jgi:hypothetical protein
MILTWPARLYLGALEGAFNNDQIRWSRGFDPDAHGAWRVGRLG